MNNFNRKKISSLLITLLFVITACSSLSVTERETKRGELDEMAVTAIAGLVEQDAALQQEIDDSLGYAVANMKVTKVPIFGAGGGEGVFVNRKTNKRIYFTVSRFDVGGGWGARSYKILLIFKTQEMLDRFDGGAWEFQAGVKPRRARPEACICHVVNLENGITILLRLTPCSYMLQVTQRT